LLPVSEVAVFAGGLDHPEGVTVGPDGAVWAGGELGQLYRMTEEDPGPALVGTCGGFTLGLHADGFGNVYVCDPIHRCVQRFSSSGECHPYGDGSPAPQIVAPNHLAFDSRGNLYVSDSGVWKHDDGKIYRLAPGGRGEIWSTALRTVPNGIALGPGETHLYVAMSLHPGRIARIAIEADGSAGEAEDYALMEGTVPDGLAFAENGDLYVATYRPDAIYVVRAGTRAVELYVSDPLGDVLASPTNLAFGTRAGAPALFVANIGRWHVAAVPVAVAGLPLAYPTDPRLGGRESSAARGAPADGRAR
jgi:gluconolactonase